MISREKFLLLSLGPALRLGAILLARRENPRVPARNDLPLGRNQEERANLRKLAKDNFAVFIDYWPSTGTTTDSPSRASGRTFAATGAKRRWFQRQRLRHWKQASREPSPCEWSMFSGTTPPPPSKYIC